jgi:hypothetical protein
MGRPLGEPYKVHIHNLTGFSRSRTCTTNRSARRVKGATSRIDCLVPGEGAVRIFTTSTLAAANTASNADVKLGVPVTDQKPEPVDPIVEVHQEVASLLGDPGAGGVGGDPGQVYFSSFDFDDEQHVQPGQPDRVDGEAVGGQQRTGLGAMPQYCDLDSFASGIGPRPSMPRSRVGPSTPPSGPPHDPACKPASPQVIAVTLKWHPSPADAHKKVKPQLRYLTGIEANGSAGGQGVAGVPSAASRARRSVPHAPNGRRASLSDFPCPVREYSTRGGTSR